MAAAIFHLTNTDNAPNRYAIEQGATFNWLTLVIDGDFTGWQPRGQIRDRYASQGGKSKATFEFPPLVIGTAITPGGNVTGTLLKPRLSYEQTAALDWAESKMTVRQTAKDQVVIGKNVWVYDIEMESPGGDVIRIMEGYAEVRLEATR